MFLVDVWKLFAYDISSALIIIFHTSTCVMLVLDDALMESESPTAAGTTELAIASSPNFHTQQEVPVVAKASSTPQGSDCKIYLEILRITWVVKSPVRLKESAHAQQLVTEVSPTIGTLHNLYLGKQVEKVE